MGGDSPKAPQAPNYQPLIDTQLQFAQKAMQLSDQQWAELTRLQQKYEPTWDKVIEAATHRMELNDKWAVADRQRYEKIFAPVEDRIAKEAMTWDQPWRMEAEAGKAEADIAQQFEQSRQAAMQRLENLGVDPSQTRSAALDSQSRVVEAAAQAAAGNTARDRVQNQAFQLRNAAAQIGRGIVAQGQGEAGIAGSAGGQAAGTGIAGLGAVASAKGTPAQWFQQGSAAQDSAIKNTLGFYQAEIEKYKAESANDKGSGVGDIIGQIVGMGFKAFNPFGKMAGGFGAAEGGAIPEPGLAAGGVPDPTGGNVTTPGGGMVPQEISPSRGAIPDDVPAQVSDGGTAKLEAGEFVFPRDVMEWRGQQWAQKEILKARKEMTDPQKAPAQPSPLPPEGVLPGMPPPPGAGAIPAPMMG